MMNINYTFKKMDATEALKARVKERTEKLQKFLGKVSECAWVFFVEADEHVAEMRVTGPHIDYFAQAKTSDMYASIDECVDKIEKQLRKHKEIVKDHLHRGGRAPSSDEA
jgi:putative sigma-54 modulation protein